ncbi:MAG: DNA replication/repair protein RecF, partial [Clostridia bacterium]
SVFHFSDGINIIRGNNAQGKTNLLEAIFFLSCAKSFRAKKESELISFGECEAEIKAKIYSYSRCNNIKIGIKKGRKRSIYVNEVKKIKISDYVGTLQSVLFSPDDLFMIKEGPAIRRRFINIAISQLKPIYIHYLSVLNRILEQKSMLLKNNTDEKQRAELLDIYNIKLAQVGAHIVSYRNDFINEIAEKAKEIHYEMSNNKENLQIVYICDRYITDFENGNEVIAKSIYSHLCERKKAEIDSKSCLIGPQRDDIEILINGKSARFFASQGQIRTATLALKLAEREVFFKHSGEFPVLLLDDVMSELDEERQNYILNKIGDGQVFITSCDNLIASPIVKGRAFTIEGGAILCEEEI